VGEWLRDFRRAINVTAKSRIEQRLIGDAVKTLAAPSPEPVRLLLTPAPRYLLALLHAASTDGAKAALEASVLR
jgi:hypothetical protein